MDDTNAPKQQSLPPELRKSAQILGLDVSAELTVELVHQAWRHEITTEGCHPDLGGHPETAVLLNVAKDRLTRWLEGRAPKLGRQFPMHGPK